MNVRRSLQCSGTEPIRLSLLPVTLSPPFRVARGRKTGSCAVKLWIVRLASNRDFKPAAQGSTHERLDAPYERRP